jgi:hypothetical protein
MKVILYIADTGSIVDKIINLWTGLYGYSHSEIVFDKFKTKDGKYLCCSSSPIDRKVRFEYINIHTDHWYVVDIDVDYETEVRIYNEMKSLEGAKYDWKGILFTFIFRWFKKQDDKKWWCSEICAYILNKYCMPMRIRIHPNKLAKKLKAPNQPFTFSLGFTKRF